MEDAIRVQYNTEDELQLEDGLVAKRVQYNAVYIGEDGDRVFGVTETYSPLGLILRMQAHLNPAAAYILVQSRAFGEPTQVYTEDAGLGESGDVVLTAEWYHDGAVEAEIPQSRLDESIRDSGGVLLETEKLEDCARSWFSID